MVWGRWGARVACMVVVGMCALLGPGIVPSSASTLHPVATVGMPFTGQWVSNFLVAPPYTNYHDYPAVKPANNGGDWSENEYAPEGTPIKLNVTSPDGPVTFHWLSSTASCDGNSSKMDVFVNGTRVGWIFFAHFAGGRGTNTSDPQPTNGMTLGTMHDFDPITQNGCNDGPHVHIEMYNYVNYSCWTDNGQPGVTLDEGAAVGMLGSMNTAAKQPCATSTPPPPGPAGYQVVSGSGSTALYCPTGVDLGQAGTAGSRGGGGRRAGAGGAGGSPGCGSNGGAGRNGGSGTNKAVGGAGGAGGNGACPPERYANGVWVTADGTQTAAAPPCDGTGANGGNGGPGGQAQGTSPGGAGGAGGNALFAGGGSGGDGAAGGNAGKAKNTQGGAGGNGGNGGSGPGTIGGNGGQGGNGGTATGAYGGNGGRGGDGGASQPGGAGTAGGNGTTTPGANGTNGANGT